MLQMRINEINELYNRTMSIMDFCPAPLKLDYKSASASVMWVLSSSCLSQPWGWANFKRRSISPDWDERIKSDIHTIFFDPDKHDMDLGKDFYLVQQANIYITQVSIACDIIVY